MKTRVDLPPHRGLLVLISILFFTSMIGLGSWGLIETSEARYAEISREMMETGNYWHPQLLGIKHYHKPPLTYWITTLGYRLFGVDEFGARFFLVISYMLQIALLFFIAAKVFQSEQRALVAATIYGTLPMMLVSMRGLTTDSYLTTFILAAIAAWLQWRFTNRAVWLYGIALSLALGFLTKGPLVLLVPLLVMAGLQHIPAAGRTKFTAHHVLAFLLFLVAGLSWFYILVSADKTFLDYFLFRHTLDRFAEAEVFKRAAPWWYYLVFAPLLALPWIVVFFFRIRGKDTSDEKMLIRKLMIFWIGIPLLFFSLASSKLVLYILPLYGGIALVVTHWLFALTDMQLTRFRNSVFGFAVVLIVGVSGYALSGQQITVPLWFSLFPVAVVVVLLVLHYRMKITPMLAVQGYTLALTVFLLISSAVIMQANELVVNSTKPISKWIMAEGLANRPVLMYNRIWPSISFDLKKPVITLQDGHYTTAREVQFEKDTLWREHLYNLKERKDSVRLLSVLREPSVMIVKGDLKPGASWLLQYYPNQLTIDKWRVFYN